jgi:hypothetical protein
MTQADALGAYRKRWQAVEAFQKQEQLSASLELRWQQLNAAYGMAKGLGLIRPDPSEVEVFERWARLKEAYLATQNICSNSITPPPQP